MGKMGNGALRFRMRTAMVLAVLFSMLASGWALGQQTQIRIGVSLSLSGAVASLGTSVKEGMDLAVSEINATGGVGGRTLVLTILDDQSQPDTASINAQRFVSESAFVLLGGSNGSTANSMSAIAEREKVPFITPTGVTFEEQKSLPYSFFTLANFQDVSRAILAHAQAQGHTRVALLRLSREYGQIGSTYLNQYASEYGIQIVAEEQGTDSDTDFTPQLTRIRASNPTALVIWFANPAGSLILNNLEQLGIYDWLCLAPASMATRALLTVAGEAAEGVVLQGQVTPGQPLPRAEHFVSAYTALYAKTPFTFEAVGYDLVYLAKAAIESVLARLGVGEELTRDAIRAALNDMDFEGAGTVIHYTSTRHDPSPETIVLMRVQGGQFVAAQ
jgi:branched-chain amino acid transport system substrate-binding protein